MAPMTDLTVHPPPRGTLAARLAGWGLVAGSTLIILVLTLTPAGPQHQLATPIQLCVICGEFGLANLLRNVLLFVPLGLGLGLIIRRPLLAWLPALALTLAVEAVQIFVPGRNPLPIDVLANGAGAALGVLFLVSLRVTLPADGLFRDPSPAGPPTDQTPPRRTPGTVRLALAGWILLPFGALTATAVAFQLQPPTPPHFVQITPSLGHLETYRGQVREARLAGEALHIGRHPDPDRLENHLFGGARLDADVQVGPPPLRLAPLVSVYTGAQRELFLLGAHRHDVVLRLPYRATHLRLHPPDLRLPGGLEGMAPGRETSLSFWMEAAPERPSSGLRTSAGACLAAAHRAACDLRPGIRDGWSLLYPATRLHHRLRQPVGVLWLLGLGFLPGLVARSALRAGGLAAGLTAFAWVVPWATGSMAWARLPDLALLAGGAALGALVRRGLRHLCEGRPRTTPVAPPQHRGSAPPETA